MHLGTTQAETNYQWDTVVNDIPPSQVEIDRRRIGVEMTTAPDSSGFVFSKRPEQYGPFSPTPPLTWFIDGATRDPSWPLWAADYYEQVVNFIAKTGKIPEKILNADFWINFATTKGGHGVNRQTARFDPTLFGNLYGSGFTAENIGPWISSQRTKVANYFKSTKSISAMIPLIAAAILIGPTLYAQLSSSAGSAAGAASSIPTTAATGAGTAATAAGSSVPGWLSQAGSVISTGAKIITAASPILSAAGATGGAPEPDIYTPTAPPPSPGFDIAPFMPYVLGGLALLVVMRK